MSASPSKEYSVALHFLWVALAASTAILLFAILPSDATSEEKRIAIFSNVASYSLPVVDVGGREYTGLLEVLEPLGTVTAKADPKHWKLRYNNIDLEFSIDKPRVRMKGADFDLGAPFVMQSGRGMVPISALGPLLSRILGGPVTFNSGSRRIFIGNVGVHFTAQVTGSAPPSLVMKFSAPVNPTIATEAGKLRMTFTHEPLVPSGTQILTFNNSSISSAAYQEGNGTAEMTISGSGPLFASFSNDRKTITIAPAPSPVLQAQSPVARVEPANVPPAGSQTAGAQSYFAVIDASHGGDDRGAVLAGELVEKNFTLVFAQRLQHEIESRGLPTLLLRNSDATLSLDERAGLANAAHPSLYLCIHVTSQGSGVGLYTAMLPSVDKSTGTFLQWDTAQQSSLPRSQSAAAILARSFENSRIVVRTLSAPLRPLNNITTAAIAIEIAPPASGSQRLYSSEYQQFIASTIASGVVAMREKLEVAP